MAKTNATMVFRSRALAFVGFSLLLMLLVPLAGLRYGDEGFMLAAGAGGAAWILLLFNWVIKKH